MLHGDAPPASRWHSGCVVFHCENRVRAGCEARLEGALRVQVNMAWLTQVRIDSQPPNSERLVRARRRRDTSRESRVLRQCGFGGPSPSQLTVRGGPHIVPVRPGPPGPPACRTEAFPRVRLFLQPQFPMEDVVIKNRVPCLIAFVGLSFLGAPLARAQHQHHGTGQQQTMMSQQMAQMQAMMQRMDHMMERCREISQMVATMQHQQGHEAGHMPEHRRMLTEMCGSMETMAQHMKHNLERCHAMLHDEAVAKNAVLREDIRRLGARMETTAEAMEDDLSVVAKIARTLDEKKAQP